MIVSESTEERIYRDELYVIQKAGCSNKYIRGKVVGFIDHDTYKIALEDKKIGKIECFLLDSKFRICNGEFVINHDIEKENYEKSFLKHIGKEYYFEIIGSCLDGTCVLGINGPRKDYLRYIIENECIVCGYIVQIDVDYAFISIPYGLVFRICSKYVFGCQFDKIFDYNNYVEAEVSVKIFFDKINNRAYLKMVTPQLPFEIDNIQFIFPVLYSWENSLYSKLWLDKSLQLNDRKKFIKKYIGQLQIVTKIRNKGSDSYKANVRQLVEKDRAQTYKKHILALSWIVDLKGQNIDTAIEYLKSRHFMYQINYKFTNEEQEKTVISMSPNVIERTLIPKNMIISLTVSMGAPKKLEVPNVVGIPIKDAEKILREKNISFKVKVSEKYMENFGDNCVMETKPKQGKSILSFEELKIILNRNIPKSPFALWKNEITRLDAKGQITGQEKNLEQFYDEEGNCVLIDFILKHSVVTSKQIYNWMNLISKELVIERDIDEIVKYLINIKMLGCINLEADFSNSNYRFYFPQINLYEKYRNVPVSGRFYWQQKEVRYFKIRGAENQAFLRLYSILHRKNNIIYEVDWVQDYIYEELKEYIKIHFAIKAIDKETGGSGVYFIEAIRFLNDEQLLEAWDKVIRYTHFVNKDYPITPILILVFEDEKHSISFFDKKPHDLNLNHMCIHYTWDELTNLDIDIYEKIFHEGDML